MNASEVPQPAYKLTQFLPPRAWIPASGAVIAGLINGIAGAALIAVVNTAIQGRSGYSVALLGGAFFGLVLAKIGSNAAARWMLHGFTLETLTSLSRDLSRRIVATPLRDIERVGAPRILATLIDDVAVIGFAAQTIPAVATNIAVLAGCAVYLAYLSWQVLIAVTVFVIVASAIYKVLITRAYKFMQRARDTRDILFQHFRALTEGNKELKLHARRRQAFMRERIDVATESMQRDGMLGLRVDIIAGGWNQLFFYGLIGGLIFFLPGGIAGGATLDAATVTGYVLVTLYMMNPIWNIMASWPVFARGRIALDKVRSLGLALDPGKAEPAIVDAPTDWQRIELDGVTFAYPPDAEGQSFVLGPIDLALERGELVFLVGGNGSGKSTLMKVLTGLYPPAEGAISLDGRVIDNDNREGYRQLFSAIFSDFYLFDTLLGLDGDVDARARDYIVQLELQDKVSIRDGAFSTLDLSQGQRKRLALLTAYLEDRPIYVFDEWAADQDPHYREIFYRRLLPELRGRGHTVVVISHDDRYYHLGDRVIRLDYGRVATAPAETPAAATTL